MRICIYGAGAGGGHFAVRLARAGHDVSVVARGDNLAAIRSRGIRLLSGDEDLVAAMQASDDAASLGVQDVVIVAVKATALASVAGGLKPLIGARTQLLFGQNGMPWWYPLGHEGPPPPKLKLFNLARPFVESVPAERILGALVFSANEMREPGVVVNNSPGANRLVLGPIVKSADVDVSGLRKMFDAARLASPPTADIRGDVWRKLIGNMSGSALALAIGNRSSTMRTDAALGAVYLRLVREGLAIAGAHGYPLDDVVPEAMQAVLYDHKPSILQDYEQRRPMEIAEIVLAPLEFARAAGVDAPALEVVAAIVARLARDRGLF
jgi:2-dehydropantoate 2-reductase